MQLKNINGTSQLQCRCGSWLNHWKNYGGGTIPTYCPVSGCYNKDLVGAHVQKADGWDYNWYICPLCNEHNKSTVALTVPDATILVSANKKDTCERW